jgi:hypothetical protein
MGATAWSHGIDNAAATLEYGVTENSKCLCVESGPISVAEPTAKLYTVVVTPAMATPKPFFG